MIPLLLALLALPLLSRLLIFFGELRCKPFWAPGYFFGIMQDLFIAALLFLLLTISDTLYFFFSFLVAVALVYHIVDALLLLTANFRMQFSFYRYLFEFGDFKSSAEAFGIRPMAFGVAFSFFSLLLFFIWSKDIFLQVDKTYLFPLIAVSALLSSLSCLGTVKSKMYLYNNCLFKEVENLFELFMGSKQPRKAAIQFFKPQCETYRTVSPHYPLLKITEGFCGEKEFELRVGKDEKPHVILIAVESLGARHMGCLGNPYGATPNLDSMAREGILYSNFHAAGLPTSRSLLGTLFGIYPDMETFSLQERNPLFPLIGIQDLFKEKGYRTIYNKGGSIAFLNASAYLKNHGFAEISGDDEIVEKLSRSSRTSWGVHDEELFDYSLQQLIDLDQRKESAFMVLCTISNHHPWQPPDGFIAPKFDLASPLYARYLQTLYYSDAMIGKFIQGLRKNGLSENSVIFITADNGQPMGEHKDNYMPLRYCYKENHHIPLLIYAEGRISQSRIIDSLGSQVDLMPTMMDLFGLSGMNHSIGTSLARKANDRHVFSVNPHILPYATHLWKQYKYNVELESNEEELFDLSHDPEERNNLIGTESSIAQRLKQELLNQLTSLQILYHENRITPDTDKSIVRINDPQFSDHLLIQEGEKHPELRSVLVSACEQITDEGFQGLTGKIGEIEYLFLDKLHITDASLEVFRGKTSKLKGLTISNCLGISSKAIASLLKECPLLEELTLTGIVQLEDEALKAISDHCNLLNNLELPECFGLTDQGFNYLALGLPKLRRLNLYGTPQITDDTLHILAKGKYRLQALHLLECPEVGEEGLLDIVKNNPTLQRLSFPGSRISDEALEEIIDQCKDLMKLCIYDCQNLTEKGFLKIATDCSNLIILELAGCPNLSDDFFAALANKPIDHLLIAGAPNITDESLVQIGKISTLRNLILLYCQNIKEQSAWKLSDEMRRTGLLREMTFNRTKRTFS